MLTLARYAAHRGRFHVIKLETERLLFRDHEARDLDEYCAMESDPQYRWPQVVHPRADLERRFNTAWILFAVSGIVFVARVASLQRELLAFAASIERSGL